MTTLPTDQRAAPDAGAAPPDGVAPVPERPTLDGLEAKWSARWAAEGTYRFDRTARRAEVYSIDTPPPTVSGSLHVGHVFSFTHTDLVARYQRMQGKAVFYPMGWDDNGLPTERRVQNYFGVRCDPDVPYDPDFTPPDRPPDPPLAVSRPNFVELCYRLTAEDEVAFEELFRTLGLSVDWEQHYTTISDRARRTSQRSFLDLLAAGHAYQVEAPTLWDVDFRTAVSQAELEDRERPGAYHRVRFARVDGGGAVAIETTRPELLPACVALVAHPDDERYRPLFGTEVRTPLFGVRVPVLAHELADPEKGSGIAMICTFGDTTDVVWWRELGLPLRSVMGRDGRLGPAPFGEPGWESDDPDAARAAYAALEGRTARQAQTAVVALLADSGDLEGEPRAITHPVKFYERGERPLEIVTSRQWFVRTLPLRQRLLERGAELHWHPPFMEHRYRSWVEGLNSDWNVSRQRYFGVPIPLWYPVGADGTVDHGHPLVPDAGRLPVDPSTDVPEGYTEAQRGRPGGFVGDPDVFDTWATSSLTPQIAGGWLDDPDLFARVFPFDLRPQAHEIIRTWLFSTVVRAELGHGSLPFTDVAISGWILDPDRKKMSKSKGNVVTPLDLLGRMGTDAVRYWAACGRPGTDTAFDEGQMKVGRRLAIKVLNASSFVRGRLGVRHQDPAEVTAPLDRALLATLAGVVTEATAAFDGYDYARALQVTESFFWTFCDDYLELVKGRAYGDPDGAPGPATASARAALGLALDTLHRLFAPFLPFVTEEVWSWGHPTSVHRAPWPRAAELVTGDPAPAAPGPPAGPALLTQVAGVLGEVRRAKTAAKRSMRSRVARLEVTAPPDVLAALRSAGDDLVEAGGVDQLALLEGPPGTEVAVAVELAEE